MTDSTGRVERTRSLVFFAVLVHLGITLPANAITLFNFRGVVQDLIGRPLAGAQVMDQNGRAALTGSDGRYTLPEEALGQYTLTSSRRDAFARTVIANADVPADQTVDFTLPYYIGATISRSAVTTASGPASTTLTVKTGAPGPGTSSCVKVTDSRTSIEHNAVYQLFDETTGLYTWTLDLTLPQGTTEGTFQLSYTVRECTDGRLLTNATPRSVAYIIDNTPPLILRPIPRDVSNTMLTLQPLVAEVRDTGGSGLQTGSVAATIEDLGAPHVPPQPMPQPTSTYDAPWEVLVTTPVPLALGHDYRARFTASDLAGNATVIVSEFRQSSLTVPPTTAKVVSPAGADTGVIGDGGDHVWKFADVGLQLAGYAVSVGQPRHLGFGWIPQVVSFQNARIHYWLTPDGRERGDPPLVLNPFLPGVNATGLAPRKVFEHVNHLEPDAPTNSLYVNGAMFGIGDVQLELPSAARQSVLVLDDAGTDPPGPCNYGSEAERLICVAKWMKSTIEKEHVAPAIEGTGYCHWTSGGPYCDTDYLVYYVTDDEARTMAEADGANRAEHLASVGSGCDASCQLGETLPANVSSLLGNLVMDPLTGEWLDFTNEAGVNSLWWDCVPRQVCPGPAPPSLHFPESYMPVVPEERNRMCADWLTCTMTEAEDYWANTDFDIPAGPGGASEAEREQCLDADGNPVSPNDQGYA